MDLVPKKESLRFARTCLRLALAPIHPHQNLANILTSQDPQQILLPIGSR
jgi:hypothetical protein